MTSARCVLPHHTDPDRPRPARVGLLCAGHRAALDQLLSDLLTLSVEGSASLVRHGNPGQRVGGTTEPPLPFHDEISDALRCARDRLASWASLVVEEHPSGLHPPRFGLASCVDFLSRWADWLAEQPWVDELMGELGDTRHALLAAVRPSHARRVPLGPCLAEVACEVATRAPVACEGVLRATVHNTDENLPAEITCPDCGQVHEPESWTRLARKLRDINELWLTGAQLALMSGVPIGTVQRWASEAKWRRLTTRPVRYHAEDFQVSYDAHDRGQEATA